MNIIELYFEETNPLQSIRLPTFLSLFVNGWKICMMLQLININSHAVNKEGTEVVRILKITREEIPSIRVNDVLSIVHDMTLNHCA